MLIILDFDGVIFEAKWRNLFRAYEKIIKMAGKNPKDFFQNIGEFKKWWHLGWQKNNQEIGIGDWANKIFYEIYNSGLNLFSWADNMIRTLYQKHDLVILTNRHKVDAKKYLKPVEYHFSLIVGCEDVKKLKPDPEGINLILWKRKIFKTHQTLSDVLIIGDEVGDIRAGQAAGIKTGAVPWGLGDWEQLLALNPDYVFEKHQDLLKI